MTAQEVYDAITNLDKTAFWVFFVPFSGADCVKQMAGDISLSFLRAAQAGATSSPYYATNKYTTYEDAPAEYQDFIYNDIYKSIHDEYGYEPSQVNGYNYATNSKLSTTIAADSDFKAFVKKYIKELVNGKVSPENSKRLVISKNKDLWGSIHGADVIGAKLNGTKLTLTIYDLYDFDKNAGDVLNGAGAAAMKDGKLKPFFMLINVTIDLTTLGFTAKEIEQMKS